MKRLEGEKQPERQSRGGTAKEIRLGKGGWGRAAWREARKDPMRERGEKGDNVNLQLVRIRRPARAYSW